MNPEKPRIVVTEPLGASALDRLRAVGEVSQIDGRDPVQLRAAVADCHAMVVRTYTRVTAEVIAAAPKLRVIARAGVGTDNIDVEAAQKRGVVVVNTPGAATDSVADLTVGLMLCLLRRITKGDAAVREGRFLEERAAHACRELSELTLGIVGLGRIGRAVARRCRNGFGMRVVYNDLVDPGWLDFTCEPMEKEPLYQSADVICLCVPLTPETRRMVNSSTLANFKPGAVLINTARGELIDAGAVAEALRAGTLAGCAVDVLDVEPPPPDHPLLSAPNVVFTPHVGARTTAGLRRMEDVVDDVIGILKGQKPMFEA